MFIEAIVSLDELYIYIPQLYYLGRLVLHSSLTPRTHPVHPIPFTPSRRNALWSPVPQPPARWLINTHVRLGESQGEMDTNKTSPSYLAIV